MADASIPRIEHFQNLRYGHEPILSSIASISPPKNAPGIATGQQRSKARCAPCRLKGAPGSMIYACWLLEMFDFRNRPFRRMPSTRMCVVFVRLRAWRPSPAKLIARTHAAPSLLDSPPAARIPAVYARGWRRCCSHGHGARPGRPAGRRGRGRRSTWAASR